MLSNSSLPSLIDDMALLVMLGVLYDVGGFWSRASKSLVQQVVAGILIGGMGVAVMLRPWQLMPELVFDVRGVLLCVSGLFFGSLPTIVAMLTTAAYRLHEGGQGVWAGLGGIATSGAIGMVWHCVRGPRLEAVSLAEFYVMGLAAHSVASLWMFLLPWPLSADALSNILVPAIVLFPIGTTLLGWLMRSRLVRHRLEMMQRESEAKFHALFENSMDAILLTSPDGSIQAANPAACQMFEREEAEIIRTGRDGLVDTTDPRLSLLLSERGGTGRASGELLMRRGDGAQFPVEISSAVYRDANGTMRTSMIIRDIAHRKNAEEDRERLSLAIEQAAEAIVITDHEAAIVYVNPAFEQVTGYTCAEAVGQNPRILKSGQHDAGFYAKMWETLTRGDVWRGLFVNRRKDGTLYTEDAVISPVRSAAGTTINYVAVKRDVTMELQLEEQFRQAQKMEAIGALTGGIAHDFNNILFAIGGHAELLRDELAEAAPRALPLVNEILVGSERARALVGQILAFSRKVKIERRVLRLGALVNEVGSMLRGAIPSTVEIAVETAGDDDLVLGDSSQLHQVVVNLCTNAWQAMAERGGTLTLRVEPFELTESAAGAFVPLVPGSYVRLSASDTGIGIPAEHLGRIFEPFFTTKEAGEGTGLGLCVVHGVVKDHGGAIDVASEVGRGTTFTILLPRSRHETEETAGAATEEAAPRGYERILIVDDEESILNVLSRLLVSLGYHVTTRLGGPAALDAFLAAPDSFDLVLTDLTMPRLTGLELGKRILDVRPDMRLILCTGYGDKLTPDNAHELGFGALLLKPVRRRELARVVRCVLDRSVELSEGIDGGRIGPGR